MFLYCPSASSANGPGPSCIIGPGAFDIIVQVYVFVLLRSVMRMVLVQPMAIELAHMLWSIHSPASLSICTVSGVL